MESKINELWFLLKTKQNHNPPNAKMVAKLIFFRLCANQTNQPRSEGTYFVCANEASEAN